ncbi:transporter substrate-binding domain-containing protein [Kiloniella antarctica]|uniref:Transporter substrate-binding domain-containing protein n=1 Tax=Kiloniella antarctica TaxID=1550907 RepID=A0ABW5BQ60_9PROT
MLQVKISMFCKIFFVTISLLLIERARADTITLSGDEWSPYLVEKPEVGGVVYDIVNTAFLREGHQVKWEFYPWARALFLARTGKVTGLADAWFSEERKKDFLFSDPFLINRLSFLKRRDEEITWDTYEDLTPYTIAQVNHAVVSAEFEKADYLKKHKVPTVTTALKLLLSGRVDLFGDDEINIMETMKKDLPEGLEMVDFVAKPIVTNKLYFISSRSRPDHIDVINIFNAGLAKLMTDGTYQKILDKHQMGRLTVLP